MYSKVSLVGNMNHSFAWGIKLWVQSDVVSQVALMVKNPPANAGNAGETGSIPGLERFPWRRAWQPTPVFFAGESHGKRSLVGCSPWGHEQSDTTERAHAHTRARAHTHTHTHTLHADVLSSTS